MKLQRMAIDDQDDMLADATSDSSGGSSAYGANFPNVNGGGVI